VGDFLSATTCLTAEESTEAAKEWPNGALSPTSQQKIVLIKRGGTFFQRQYFDRALGGICELSVSQMTNFVSMEQKIPHRRFRRGIILGH
jgi:hypothetical protein